jgi:hypothetical protein
MSTRTCLGCISVDHGLDLVSMELVRGEPNQMSRI